MTASNIVEMIRKAGVVGAGGAGFPTAVKAAAKAEIVICNGAECEPLLYKDKELLRLYPELVLEGLELMMRATGATAGWVAIKGKYLEITEIYKQKLAKRSDIKFFPLGDFYPSGDEFLLVHDVTGRLIPPAGLPIQVGVVVDNVETLINVALAAKEPVVDSWLTVTGAVKKPCTLKVPVGTSYADLLKMAGGATAKNIALLDGGAMMGKVVTDLSERVKKTTGGLIVLPAEHGLIRKKAAPREVYSKIGRSVCDQCSLCTQMCPRYLLGYNVEPHRVMRSLGFTTNNKKPLDEWALLCCECSLCSLYACPEDLDPRNVCVSSKGDLRTVGITWKNAQLNVGQAANPHPMKDYRKTPIPRLIKRLGLSDYDLEAPMTDEETQKVSSVKISLQQHIGKQCTATVTVGQKVKRGDLIGDLPTSDLGAPVHASITGTVTAVDGAVTIEA